MNSIKVNQIILLILLLFISVIFFAMIRYFLMVIFLAAIFSALAMPVLNRFEHWFGGKKNLSAAMTMLTMLFIVFLPLAIFLGIVVKQAVRISSIAVFWFQRQLLEPAAVDMRLRSLPFYHKLELYREDILRKIGEFVGNAASMLFNTISSVTYSALNDLFLLFVFLYTMFFFLRDGRQLLTKTLSFFPLTHHDQYRLLDKFLSVTRATIKGSLVVGMVQGSLAGLALHLAGIDNALFWGTIMSLVSVVPVLGTSLVWLPAVIYLAATGQYPQAIGVLLFCSIVVSQVDSIFRPILIGRDTQMHELLIFFGTLGGIILFGVVGIILGPIVAALFMTVWEMYGEAFGQHLLDIQSGKLNEF